MTYLLVTMRHICMPPEICDDKIKYLNIFNIFSY